MITLKAKKLTSFSDKSIGLLGTSKPHPVYFQTRFGIHTFGMKYPIDVVILDINDVVVKIKEYLKPNKLFLWNPKFDQVIELPNGEIEKNKIKVGEKIKLFLF